MNRCKHCGKEIAEDRQFCSRSCSNKHRERKPWTEEQHLKNRRRIEKERHCKYCDRVIDSGQVCSECKQFNHLGLYRKLGLTSGSLKSRYEKAFDILYQAYFQENLSVWNIFDKYRVCHSTLKTLFNSRGINLRTLEEGARLGMQEERVHIPGGGNSNRHYKCGWHTSWMGSKVYYRSSYELKYAQWLDEQRVRYEVESKRVQYVDTRTRTKRIAIPDFYLPESNMLVEIKSRYTYNEQNMKDKFKAYRESGYKPILILEGKEVQL